MTFKDIKVEAKKALVGRRFMFFLAILIVGLIVGGLAFILIGILVAPALYAGLFLIAKKILANKDDIDFNDIFHYRDLNHAVKLLGVAFLHWLLTILGLILFIIPGVIFFYRYSQALFIMAENPDLGPWEAMKKSQELMRGYKFNFFLFQLSFILHGLLRSEEHTSELQSRPHLVWRLL